MSGRTDADIEVLANLPRKFASVLPWSVKDPRERQGSGGVADHGRIDK